MVGIQTDSEQPDFGYAMSSDMASLLGNSGFAEAARAFQYTGIDGDVPDAVRAQLSMIAGNRTVTQDDIDTELSELILRIGNPNDPAVYEGKALLQSLVGKPLSALAAANSRLETLTSMGQNRTSEQNDPGLRTQRLIAIAQEIESIYEKQRANIQALYDSGAISKEKYDSAMEAIGKAEEVNRTQGPGTDASAKATAAAAAATTAAADEAAANGGDPSKVGDIGANNRKIDKLQKAAEAINAEIAKSEVVQQAGQPSESTRITAAAPSDDQPIIISGSLFARVTTTHAGAMQAAEESGQNEKLEVAESQTQTTRLQYAEFSVAQSLPVQITPAKSGAANVVAII